MLRLRRRHRGRTETGGLNMQTVLGILIQPYEEQRISLLIDAMRATRHWLSVDDCLYEIFQRGVSATERLTHGEEDHAC